MSVLNQRHADVLKRLKKNRKEMHNDHELRMIDIDKKVQEEQMRNRSDFADRNESLLAEREKLTHEAKQLEDHLSDLIATGCRECNQKKETIRLMLERKNELQEQMDNLLVDAQDNEEQLWSVMALQRPQVVAPNVDFVRASLGRRPIKGAPTRAHSSLASRSWQTRVSPR
jgi:seryl-tRNA synthetase